MNEYEEVKLQRFDQVRLITVKNVSYLSAPPDAKVTPDGLWSVVSILNTASGPDLLLAKHNAIIRIPATDVLKILTYDVADIVKPFGRLSHGEGKGKES